MTDIVDSKYYRTLCGKGEFLHSSDNISAVFNNDGIPLYSSSSYFYYIYYIYFLFYLFWLLMSYPLQSGLPGKI